MLTNFAPLTIRTAEPVRLKPGVDLVDVLHALDEFMTLHSVGLHDMLDPEDVDFGTVPMSRSADVISLTEGGVLSFELGICADAFVEQFGKVDLAPLLLGSGVVEQLLYEKPHLPPTHLTVLGATPERMDEARDRYGAAQDLKALVSGAGYGLAERSATWDGDFFGPIVAVGELHVAQDVGRRQTVLHALDTLDRVPKAGELVSVKVRDGRGIVSGMSKAGHDLGR